MMIHNGLYGGDGDDTIDGNNGIYDQDMIMKM